MDPVLISGGSGQLGGQFLRLLKERGVSVLVPDSRELDLDHPATLESWIRAHSPGMVLNAGAYTAVDLAEDDQVKAQRINGDSPAVLARLCREMNIPFLHVSTDYVFADWQGERRPLRETDLPCPRGVYAHTKWLGEQAVLQENPDALVVRTSGVYQQGGKNFVGAILRRLGQTGSARVVDDQFTLPTAADFLAEKCLKALEHGFNGLLHIVPGGVASWYETACVISEVFTERTGRPVSITPIPTTSLNQKAPRPPWSILSNLLAQEKLGEVFSDWNDLLKDALQFWPVEEDFA